jgi:hypothetical protein
MDKQFILCRFSAPITEEITPYPKKFEKWAYHAVRVHNADILANQGNLEDEFWFLKEKIKAKSAIISMRNGNEFVRNDPQIVAKVAVQTSENDRSSAHNRSSSGNLGKRGYNL